MKTFRNIILVLGIYLIWFFLNSNSAGSPGGKTGSPGDGSVKCTQCHVVTATTVQNWITHNIPITGYIPGNTYTITATGTHTGVVKFGFELTAEDAANVKTGSFTLINTGQTRFTNNNKAVTHTLQGTLPSGNSKTWSMNWTAPPGNAGNIRFFAAFNAANGTGTTSGDKIYLSNTTITPDVTAGASIPNIVSCPGSEVLVPINISSFYSIGAVTLYIEYDTSALFFNSVVNINNQFPGLIANAMNSPVPRVGISWSSLTPATVISGKLLDINFTHKKNASGFTFSPDCEIVNSNLGTVTVSYTTGSINPIISVSQHPQNQNVYEPNQAIFQCFVAGADNYQWKESTDGGVNYTDLAEPGNYSGVNTNSLLIQSTTINMNNYHYKCVGINGNCSLETNPAKLTVSAPLITNTLQIPSGWSGISSYINPVNQNINSILEPLGTNLVIMENFNGVYFPAGNVYTLNNWDAFSGYFIKLVQPSAIDISGYPTTPRTINLITGWNLIPVISACNVNTAILFAFSSSKLSIIAEVAGSGIYWPEMGINSLPVLVSGKSYFLKAKQNFTLTFPGCADK